MIALENASVEYGGVAALDGFTGSFPPRQVTALIGGDGAGKSTLLRALAGSLPLTSGRRAVDVERAEIGYQPADAGVWRNLSVDENIEFVSRVYGASGPRHRERVEELLRRAGLEQARRRVAGRLSGGMLQKLGFILATLHRPALVLLDEPTTGVDPVSRGELWRLVTGAAEEGATVVLATTYLDEAERAAGLFLLDGGRVLASGSPGEVVSRAPGRLWRAPAAVGRAVEDDPRSWRRGASEYLWGPSPGSSAPAGFEPDTPDLENASIALLLAEEEACGGEEEAAPPAADAAAHAQPGAGPEPGAAPWAETRPLVRATDVERVYGGFAALRGVSLEVAPGEVVGLLGGNGAGKTTLMRIMLGLETPTAGSCALFGAPPSLETRRRIGYVAQGLGLYPSLSALENLRFAASVHGVEVGPRAEEHARRLGGMPVARLPLGARRELAYLAASLHDPALLVLDEPTSGMDALGRARLWKGLRAAADRDAGILVTTHYMQEAAQCDRLVVLVGGSVAATGAPEEITAGRASLEEIMRASASDGAQ